MLSHQSSSSSLLAPESPTIGGTISNMFSKLSDIAHKGKNIAEKGKNIAQKGLTASLDTFHSTAQSVGLKDKVEEVERAAKWAANGAKTGAGKRWIDANKAVHKARRLAKKALDFDDEDGELSNADYDLLLSAAGATEKTIAIYKSHTQTFTIPAGSAFVWKARVKKFDIGFAVREQIKEDQPMVDIEVLSKHRSESQIQGQLPAVAHARNITLVFDNSYSKIQRKSIAYWVSIGENVSLQDDALGAARSKEVMAAEDGPME